MDPPMIPKPPLITRRTGWPVSGCLVRGRSFMDWRTSNCSGFWLGLEGMVSYR